MVECGRDGCPSGRSFHLHRGTLELCKSDHWVLGHLPDQGHSPPIAQFGLAASSRKSLVGCKLFPFKNNGGHCNLGDLQCCRILLVHFPRSVPWHNPVSELYALSTVGPYIDSCVPFQIMSNQFNLPQVDTSQVIETSHG